MNLKKKYTLIVANLTFALSLIALSGGYAIASDLEQIKKQGVLRHIGTPYANFITGQGDGLDMEIMRRFANHLGVEYQFVQSDWGNLFADLTGNKIKPIGDTVDIKGKAPVRGDIIANGLTKLKWRQQVVNYSDPTFPTQVWAIARADFPQKPIASKGDIDQDIKAVKKLLKGKRVMGKEGTCLAPGLYGIDARVAQIINFPGSLNDIAPAIIKGEADIALLDVPDSLVALEKWPGKIKVLGPVSPQQEMGAGFRKSSPELLKEFNAFYAHLKTSGEYRMLIKKYYPAVFSYYPEFFRKN